jgi:hypothetical protein
MRGEGVRLDAALKARFGTPSGAPFGGIVGAANKISRRIAGRDLIARDAALGGYRMDPLDAEIVLLAWPAEEDEHSPVGDPSAGTTASSSRPSGIPLDQAVPRRG